MRTHTTETGKIDDLDLAIETLKDLTPTATQADEVRGGKVAIGQNCYCGTM